MKVLFSISLVLLSMSAAAQLDFTPDSKPFQVPDGWPGRIDSIFPRPKDSDFELRFDNSNPSPKYRRVFILAVKAGKWDARMYQITKKDSTSFRWMETKSNKDPTRLIDQLVANRLLTMPTMQTIEKDLPEKRKPVILDGMLYYFTLKNKKGIRSYGFHCPGIWAKFFQERNEFALVKENIRLLYEFFGIDGKSIYFRRTPECTI